MEADIARHLVDSFANVHPAEAWGTTFFYYKPDPAGPDEIYFATLDQLDEAPRLNLGLSKSTFRSLDNSLVTPHPEYGRIFWVSLVNPDPDRLAEAGPLIEDAYQNAVFKYKRRSSPA